MLHACRGSDAARGQEPAGIKWHTSYAAAREESQKKNVPLVIYVTKPACIHCDRMKQSTFRDPRIIAALNDKVIALEVNLADQPVLVQKLAVSLFPTIIVARPDAGYETLVGYQEADVLHDKITRVLATLKPSEPASVDFQNAQNWEKDGDYPRAIAALRNVLDDSRAKPLQKNAEELLQKIQKRAEDRLSQAKELQAKGKLAEALDALSDVNQRFAGLKISRDAGDLVQSLERANRQLAVEHRQQARSRIDRGGGGILPGQGLPPLYLPLQENHPRVRRPARGPASARPGIGDQEQSAMDAPPSTR